MTVLTKIRRVYSLDIGISQMTMLALMLLDEKPAVELDLYKNNSSPEKVLTVLSSIGLCVYAAHLSEDRNPNHIATYCVSNSSINANLLVSIVEIRNRSKTEITSAVHIAYGALMGYPLSAIEGYVKNLLLPDNQYPIEVEDEPLMMFKLSKKNWQEEIRLISYWRSILLEHADYMLEQLDNNIVK